MKKTALVLLLAAVAAVSAFASGAAEAPADDTIKIGVSKFISHPALDAVEQGMQDYLATTDLKVSYDFQNANGDISTSASIAQKFKTDKDDIVLGIATPTAQALSNVFTDIPVLFAAVTDPVDAGLVASNVCGVSDANPVEAQIALLVEVTGAKAIGNIYASGEANGVVLMEQAKAACEKLGVQFVSAAISNSSEVKQAAQSIIDRVDAIYIATDNAVISALPAIDAVCASNNKVLFSADPSGVDGLECMIAWGFKYYSIGIETGKIIEKIQKGEAKPADIGSVILENPADFELWFNLDTAKKLGYEIPQKYLDVAAVVIENGAKTTK